MASGRTVDFPRGGRSDALSSAQIIRPSLALQLLEIRAIGELAAFLLAYPALHLAPRGDGHPVLVLPGFLASGTSTLPLRHFLKRLGYKGCRWKLGRNLGPIGEIEHEILLRVKELRERYDQKVSLVGWSLGGIYARELAWMAPDDVRQVITLGTPFRHHQSTSLSWLYQDLTGQRRAHMDPELVARMPEPPPVPSTSIYSRSDGVVPWQCSLERKSDFTENIRVVGSHCGLGHNLSVLWAIADRLAQPEGEWKPFEPHWWTGLVYPQADERE